MKEYSDKISSEQSSRAPLYQDLMPPSSSSLKPIHEHDQWSKPPVSSNTSTTDGTSTTNPRTRPMTPVPRHPGAVRVRGPGWHENDSVDGGTVQIGASVAPSTFTPSHSGEQDDAPSSVTQEPIHKRSCSFKELWKRKVPLLILLVIIGGVILGVVFGVVLKDDDSEPSTIAAPSLSPTMAPTVTFSPTTTKSWVNAGTIPAPSGANTMVMSPSGNRTAFIDARFDLGSGGELEEFTIVRVYQEENNVWSQIGNSVEVNDASSLSLMGNRLAVGSQNEAIGVLIYELRNNVWAQVGDTIDSAGWTVVLAREGNRIIVESDNEVQLYELDRNIWEPRGASISTNTTRTNEGNSYSRIAADSSGTTLLVEQSVHLFSDDLRFTLTNPNSTHVIESDPPDTPVSMSSNGKVLAIAQPQSGMNGVNNSGKVTVFRITDDEALIYEGKSAWRQEGEAIVGDFENEQFGWSHALSSDGKRIVAMNSPTDGGENRVVLLGIKGASWLPVVTDFPVAVNNGTVAMSDDGKRVAVGGEGAIFIYDLDG